MDSLSYRQFGALASLKIKLLSSHWRRSNPMYRAGVYLTLGFGATVSLVIAFLLGYLVDFTVRSQGKLLTSDEVQLIFLLTFTLLSGLWVFSPLLFTIQNEGMYLQLTRLEHYPLSLRTLHLSNILLGLLDPWTLFFYPCLVGVIVGGVMARGVSVLAGLLVLALLFVMIHLVWSRLVIDLLSAAFANRRARELMTILVLVAIILMAFAPAVLSNSPGKRMDPQVLMMQIEPISRWLMAWTPAGMLSQGLGALFLGQPLEALRPGIGLFAWMALGNMLEMNVLRRLQAPSFSANRQGPRSRAGAPGLRFPGWIPPVVAAIAWKDLRSLMRSVIGKLCFFLTPLIVVVLRLVGLGAMEVYPETSLLLGMVAYIFVTTLFLYTNSFGWDGEGFKLYLFSAPDPRQVILGKNLGLGLFALGQFATVLYLFVAFFTPPSLETLVFAVFSFGTLLGGMLTLGNFFSLRYPSPIDLNQTSYRQNAAPVVLALNLMSFVLAFPALALTLSRWSGEPLWLVSGCFLGVAWTAWYLTLPHAVRLWEERAVSMLPKVTQS
jgi:ABC-2 type transport system permease protein